MTMWQYKTSSVAKQLQSFGNLSLVLLLHILVIWNFVNLRKVSQERGGETSFLQMIDVVTQKTTEPIQRDKPETTPQVVRQPATVKKQTTLAASTPNLASTLPETANSTQSEPIEAPKPELERSPNPDSGTDLMQSANTENLRKIYRQTKQEFTQRDKVLHAAKISDIDALAQKIAASAQTNRVGVYYENFVLPNGRPVTKVNTPYGSYCIMLDKPGENPDLRLPKVPVSCGKF